MPSHKFHAKTYYYILRYRKKRFFLQRYPFYGKIYHSLPFFFVFFSNKSDYSSHSVLIPPFSPAPPALRIPPLHPLIHPLEAGCYPLFPLLFPFFWLIYVKKGENFRVFLKFSPEKFGRSARNAYLCIRFRVEARLRDKKSFFERIT